MGICENVRFRGFLHCGLCGSHLVRRVLAFVLVFALSFSVLLYPARAASVGATVAVAGGSIGTAGIAGAAGLAPLVLPVLGVVGLALVAAGVDVYLTDASTQAGMTKTEFIKGKLSDFAAARGQDFNNLVNTLASHMSVMQDGTIAIGAESGEVIQQFGNWLFGNDMVSDAVAGSGGFDGVINYDGVNYTFSPLTAVSPIVQNARTYDVYRFSSTVYPYVYLYNSYYKICFWSYEPFDYTVTTYDANYNTVMTTSSYSAMLQTDNVYRVRAILNNTTFRTDYDVPSIDPATFPTVQETGWRIISGAYTDSPPTLGDDVFTGAQSDWVENRDVLVPGAGETAVLSGPDVINPAIAAVADGSYTISVPDYLDALARAYNAGADAAIDLSMTNAATGTMEGISVSGVDGTTAELSATDSAVSGTALAVPDAAVSGADAVGVMSFPLTEIFPFCVPFDAFDLASLFVAEPVAPSYHVKWFVPIVEQYIEFDVDLSPFNSVAAVLRTLEIVLFAIGLALATRKLVGE